MDWTRRGVKNNMFYVSIWEKQIEAEAFHARPGVPIEAYLAHVAQRIRERRWVTTAKASKTISTAISAWRAWRKIVSKEEDIRRLGEGLDDPVMAANAQRVISMLIWKVDMASPRSFDVVRAKEDLRLVRDDLANLPRRTRQQDRLLAVIESGHASGQDIYRVASICIRADRIRREQFEADEDCL